MSGLKAKFTKAFNGEESDSNVGYKNFDNPVYELNENGEINFDNSNIAPSRSSAVTLDSLFSGKGGNRKRLMIIGVTAAIVLVTIIIVAAAVGSAAAKEKRRKAEADAAVSSHSTSAVSYYGNMRLTDRTFTDAYKDPASTEYIQLRAEFEKNMDRIVIDSSISKDFVGTKVIRFSAGSIVVVFAMEFRDTLDSAALNAAIVKDVEKNNGGFGPWTVDVESITVSEGSPPPPVKKATTTTKSPSSVTTKSVNPSTAGPTTDKGVTGSSITTRHSAVTKATRAPTIKTTQAPSCGHTIIPECSSVLSYNTSIRSLPEQNRMKSTLLQIARHTRGCYSDSKFYMCSVIAPHCYSSESDVTGDSTDQFLLPCQQLCHDYKHQCKEQLTSITNDAFTCEAYMPYTPRFSGRCAYKDTPPTIQPTTTVVPSNNTYSEVCYPIHHTYCSNIPWKSAYLPNYMGHTSLSDAYDFLSFMQALQDSGMHCHDALHTLICGSLLPKCDDNHQRVPPCKSLCLDVLSNCTLMLANLPIHVPISCSIFTEDTNCTNVGGPLPPSGCNDTSQYSCLNHNQCVDLGKRCNGVSDCSDGSDEIGCVNTTSCHAGQFKCSITGACLPDEWQCDSYNDCGDSSDEVGCECADGMFKCTASDNTMRCINGSQQCDGYYNCFGRQDEMNCANFTCRSDQFHCANGLCRPQRFVCDGDDDCGDMSDEQNCLANEKCLDTEFKCVNGTRQWGIGYTSCVPKAWKCDTERDCTDGSDERNCSSLCFPNPCSHGGNCTADVRGYLCVCPPGTGGSNCQIVEELPDVSCDTDIVIEACKAPLRSFHTKTIATVLSQNQVAPYITAGITKFDSCYEHAAEFLCQYAVPQCGSLAFPMFPCKSMCREFKARCAHKLNETQSIDRLIDCDTLIDDSLYEDAECFKLQHSTPTVAPPAETELGCQDLKVEFCKDEGYNTTYFPNFFNQTHQVSAEWFVEQFEYAHSNMPTCNPYLKRFGCALAVPECDAEGTGRIPPCKDLCEAVAFDCGYWMDHMQWRFPFTCDQFPQSNDSSVCVQLPAPVRKVGCYGDQFECGSGECIHKTFQCDNFPDCDDGSDEETTMCVPHTGCTENQFDCGDGSCIPKHWRCDSDNDCPLLAGASISIDEKDCVCSVNEKKCANGLGCYSSVYECDGYSDCSDGSDEASELCVNGTHCHPSLFTCATGECINRDWVCDVTPDCPDASDELNCNYCPDDSICENGLNLYTRTQCLPKSWRCDNEVDCTDGSDEVNCPTPSSTHPTMNPHRSTHSTMTPYRSTTTPPVWTRSCVSNPCLRGGTCIADPLGVGTDYICICPPQTTGDRCEILVNLVSVHCESGIHIPQCVHALQPHYNTTRTDYIIQAMFSHIITTDMFERLHQCAPDVAALVVCGMALPGCQSNDLPILPCKHTCRQLEHQCSSELKSAEWDIDCSLLPDKTVYPHTVCISSPSDGVLPDPAVPVNQPQCQPMKQAYCSSLYNTTLIPNLIGQASQAEASVYLDIISRIHSNYPLCHDSLQLYACSILAPQCRNDSLIPMMPCKQLCREIEFNCSYELGLLKLPLQFNCDDMLDYNNNSKQPNCIMPQSLTSVCDANSFKCTSGACVPSSAKCDGHLDCPDWSDEQNCPIGECLDHEMSCGDSGTCIPINWKCDGFVDCLGGRDEENCTHVCNEWEFKCKDRKTCIALGKRCDYHHDCPDGDDEEACNGTATCGSGAFTCNSGHCIPSSWQCDGIGDCPGNQSEDEKNCVASNTTCPSGHLKCANGVNIYQVESRCFPGHWVCDGENDCSDGSDEHNCTNAGACDSNPCANGASCEVKNGEVICHCAYGFSGTRCETHDLPAYSCDYSIPPTSTCRQYLPYHTTSTPSHVQNLLMATTESMLNHLNTSACYDMAQMFVCAVRYPSCQTNGFPLLPCRHICHEFKSRCHHVIDVSGQRDLMQINCDAFVWKSSLSFTCLNSTTVLPLPRPQIEHQPRCEALNNTVCRSLDLGYDTVSFPNLFGQTSQSEAAYLVHMLSKLKASSECRQHMSAIACAAGYPKCKADNSPLLLCRADCLAAIDKCEFFLAHYQFTLPLDCHSLPESTDPTVCLQLPTTLPTPAEHCEAGKRLCPHSGDCVSEFKWCDTQVDCFDASDEDHCDIVECPAHATRCNETYTQCVPNHWVCDTFADCPSGSDEQNCGHPEVECRDNEFKCNINSIIGNRCVPDAWRCDGEADCLGGGGEDEQGCNCTDHQFTCVSDNKCIPYRWKCDAYSDCDDNSDEADCPDTLSTHSPYVVSTTPWPTWGDQWLNDHVTTIKPQGDRKK